MEGIFNKVDLLSRLMDSNCNIIIQRYRFKIILLSSTIRFLHITILHQMTIKTTIFTNMYRKYILESIWAGRGNETSRGEIRRWWSVSAWRLPRPSHNASPSCIVPLHETRDTRRGRRGETRRAPPACTRILWGKGGGRERKPE